MPNKRASHENRMGFSGRRGNDANAGMSQDLANLRPFITMYTADLPLVLDATMERPTGLFIPSNAAVLMATIDIRVPAASVTSTSINIGFPGSANGRIQLANATGVGVTRASRTGQQVWSSAQANVASPASGFIEIVYQLSAADWTAWEGSIILTVLDKMQLDFLQNQ